MRVLINTLTVEGPKTGIGHYTSELVRALRHLHGDAAVVGFPAGWLRRARAAWERAKPGDGPGLSHAAGRRLAGFVRAGGQALMRFGFRGAAHSSGAAVYHEPNYIPLGCDLPTIASVHDLSALLYPQWHPAARVRHFEKHFAAGLKRCRHLFAISEAGKADIVRHLGFSAERVSVTYMGVRPGLRRVEGDELTAALHEMGLSEGYLLHVGTLEPRKNVLMLLKAYCSLPAALRERCPLVLVGGKGWNSEETHAYLEGEARHKGVRWLGYVEDRHFASLYSGARALLFPTFYEGFGMPTIEMMACGGAVIASTAAAVAETVGGQAHLVDPADADGWRDAMARACTDHDWLSRLRQGAAEVARPFSWERCAAASWAAYGRVARQDRPHSRAA